MDNNLRNLPDGVMTKRRFECSCNWDQFLIGASWSRIYTTTRSYVLNLGPFVLAWYHEYDFQNSHD